MSYNKTEMLPYGTIFLSDGSIEFNFWAPDVNQVKLCLEIDGELQKLDMQKNKDDLYSIKTSLAKDGMLYCYEINGDLKVPDPASRFQPDDVHGMSKLINPAKYDWEGDNNSQCKPWEETVLYELHTGTFTPEGTFKAIEEKLDYFKELGVNTIELMPVSDFPGKRNWGYDGVLHFAPDSSYGKPDDLKDLIKAAHKKGISVFLDVVYNHFGPDGNYLYCYAKSKFFDEKIEIPWGAAINFKEKFVRKFFINNVLYWLNEYHFDGLRFDAVHEVYDTSSPDILQELAKEVRKNVAKDRHIHLVLENDKNQSRYLKKDYEAQWNDDFHHCVHILATDEKDGYYGDYEKEKTGKSAAFFLARTLTEGFAYQGEKSPYRENDLRGEKSSHLPLCKFVNFIQNHDQAGNRAFGERLSVLSNNNLLKASACVYLLAPSVPMLFMGEEWGAETPFYFFCNLSEELAESIRNGRREEFSRFAQFSDPKIRETIPDPTSEETFLNSKLNWNDLNNKKHKEMFEYYQELIKIRQNKIVPIVNKITDRSYKLYSDKAFCASWKAGETKLFTFANFGDVQLTIDSCIIEENLIASSRKLEKFNNVIPPETVIWTLH